MPQALTLKEQKENIANYIWANIAKPSIYASWDNKKMSFGVYKGYRCEVSTDVIEMHLYNGDIVNTDMYILKAVHALTYAPADSIARLVQFWADEDSFYAVVDERKKRAFPEIQLFSDYFHRLQLLSRYGVVVRYAFYPESSKVNRSSSDMESIFKITSLGSQAYKKLLQDKDILFDTRDIYANPQDAFSACLLSVALTPFLRSCYIKRVDFKQQLVIERRKHNYKAAIIFNPNGRTGNEDDDTEVIFEGVAFRTDESMVTLDARYSWYIDRIKELYSLFIEKQKKHPVYMIFSCEDAAGVKYLEGIISEYAPFMLDKCLFTTGNILDTSKAIEKPEMLRNCFFCFEKQEDEQYIVSGAAGLYFLEIEGRKK